MRETVVSMRKKECQKPISALPRKQKETQSQKAVFCTIKQEIGQA
jgi:hypothetical protein